MKKLDIALNFASLLGTGLSVFAYATNNVGDAVYLLALAILAKTWS